MANVTKTINASNRFPVGTVVKAYLSYNRHFEGKPSGEALSQATVDAYGRLAISVPEGAMVQLYAEVGGVNTHLAMGSSTGFTAPPAFLRDRIALQRAAVGA